MKTQHLAVILMVTVLVLAFTVSCGINSHSDYGSIYIESYPDSAQIYIDGKNMNRLTPDTLDNIEKGGRTVLLVKERYYDWERTIEVKKDEIAEVSADLVELPLGWLVIRSNPSGANIWLNGEMTGYQTPYTYDDIMEGNYTLKLTLQGYGNWHDTVDVSDDSHTYVTANLVPYPSTFIFQSIPVGASIFLNGDETGLVTPDTIENLLPGTYQLGLQYPLYFPWQTTYYLGGGEVKEFSIQLESIPTYTIAYTNGSNIYRVGCDGLDPELMAADYDNWIAGYISYPGNIVWSPDGQYLIYNSLTEPVQIINRDGVLIDQLIGSRSVDFNWSHDSRYIVYGYYTSGIYRYDVLTNNFIRIYATPGYRYHHDPIYSPGNSIIAFIRHEWGTRTYLYTMASNGGNVRRVSNSFGTGFDEDIDLSWASNTDIIFKKSSGIYWFDLSQYDGSSYISAVQVIAASVSQLEVSPDLQYFAYVSSNRLYLGQTDDWTSHLLTEYDTIYDIAWAPDSEALFCRTNDGVHLIKFDRTEYHVVSFSNNRGSVSVAP